MLYKNEEEKKQRRFLLKPTFVIRGIIKIGSTISGYNKLGIDNR